LSEEKFRTQIDFRQPAKKVVGLTRDIRRKVTAVALFSVRRISVVWVSDLSKVAQEITAEPLDEKEFGWVLPPAKMNFPSAVCSKQKILFTRSNRTLTSFKT